MPAVPGQAPAPLDPRFSPQRPGYSPQDPLVLAAVSSTLRKEGAWTVPPYLRIAGDLGAVRRNRFVCVLGHLCVVLQLA